jgi:hypothetical protein
MGLFSRTFMFPDSTVVFFHIPKTAGSTLSAVFQRLLAGRPQFLTGGEGLSHIKDCARFVNMPEQERGAYGYVSGHLEMPVVTAVPGKPFVFTFLRDPWDRLVSLYRYVKRTPSHHLHQWIEQRNAGPEEFLLECGWDELYNGMTRRLAGFRKATTNDKRILALAVSNVQRYFSFIGIQESFDQSLFCLGRMLEIDQERLVYSKKNVSPGPRPGLTVDQAAKNRILSRNMLDCELYGIYREQFAAKSAWLLRGPIQLRFEAFKQAVENQGAEQAEA